MSVRFVRESGATIATTLEGDDVSSEPIAERAERGGVCLQVGSEFEFDHAFYSIVSVSVL